MRMMMAVVALAMPQVADVAPRDPVRARVLDALRVPVEREMRQPVRFVVHRMRTGSGWTYVEASPRRPGGDAIDLARTPYAEAMAAGGMDGDTVYALLREERGRWTVRTWVIGPTDVAWQGWPEEYGVPRAVVFGGD